MSPNCLPGFNPARQLRRVIPLYFIFLFSNNLNFSKMVTVIDYSLRESKDGKSFVSLKLEGDPEFIQSLQTGKFYLTAKRCSVTSTFTEESAKSLIGKKMRGSIVRMECESYDYTVPETGEIISLAHTYEYLPDERNDVLIRKEHLQVA